MRVPSSALRSSFPSAVLTAALGAVLLALTALPAAAQDCSNPSDFTDVIWRTGSDAPSPSVTLINSKESDVNQIMHRQTFNGAAVWSSCKVQDPADDTFVFLPKSTSADSIPVKGSGGRMMWYASRAAFRAGKVDDDDRDAGDNAAQSWNPPYVGFYSAAFGENTRAAGKWSAAFGERTTAGTDHSVSIGHCNSANSDPFVGEDGSTLFVVGNGTGDFTCQSTSDALVLDDQGNLTVNSQGTFSDRRLKTDVEPLGDGALQKLANLRPVRYEFKNQKTRPSGENIGLVAQDVRTEFPELVREGSGGYLSLAYPKLTAVLLKGLQEQQRQIEAKDETIARLRANQQTIRERLARLESQAGLSSATAGWTGSTMAWSLALLLAGGTLGVLASSRVRIQPSG
jgi:hypothetical protein